jgi:hypothetical protein
MQAGVSAPRPTHFLCWCKESKPRKHLEYNAACGGWRRPPSLRSSRWCARSRAAGALQGDLTLHSGPSANALDACAQAGDFLPRGAHAACRGLWPCHHLRVRRIAVLAIQCHGCRVSMLAIDSDRRRVAVQCVTVPSAATAPTPISARHRPSGAPHRPHASSAPVVDVLHGIKSPCRAPAARDRAHHRLERSERCLRQPPHAALYSRCFLGLLSLHQQRK